MGLNKKIATHECPNPYLPIVLYKETLFVFTIVVMSLWYFCTICKNSKNIGLFFSSKYFYNEQRTSFILCLLPQKSVANSAMHCKAQATGS